MATGPATGIAEANGKLRDAALVAAMAQQAQGRYGLFQDGGVNGSPMGQAKRIQDHSDDDSVSDVTE